MKALYERDVRLETCLNGEWDFKSEADDRWTKVRVPSAYAGVLQSWGAKQWDCFDYPEDWEGKAAVYRRTFTVPPEMKGMDIRFACNACAHHSTIVLNGKQVGEWHDGYTPFEFSLNAAVVDGENTLEVRVSEQPNDLFDDYGTHRRGIWQDTFLRARPRVAVGNDLFIKTSVADGEIVCETPVENRRDETACFRLACVVTECDGREVQRFEGDREYRLEAGKSETYSVGDCWTDPHLWFPHDPHLYTMHVLLIDEDGEVVDNKRVRFGFREISWEGPHLFINGRELFLRGHGGHYFGDIQGSRAYMETWLRKMRARGINFMRLHDSPKHRELYEVADEVGILLESEGVFHFRVPEKTEIWQGHLERLVKAQRNHPSIIVWSVSNELRWRGGGEKPEMIEWVKRFDRTRPVFASDFSLESRHGDICGHHYDPVSGFEDWEKFGPDKPMIWDEIGSVWQHDRPLDNGTSGYEAQAQDYATGLWHDGHDQILKDIRLHHEGKVFQGELHRVAGFVPWDLSYVFFRWQPTNNNQLLELSHDDLGGPGIKHNHVRPCASPINPWDPTLPEFEANPGYYLFEKYMRPVRCFDDRDERTFFADSEVTFTARIFYDDTRLADELACRVETLDGELLTETTQSVRLAPGCIQNDVPCQFRFPEVDCVTSVRLVREFRYQGASGYREVRAGKIFPRVSLPGIRCGVVGDLDADALVSAGIPVNRVEGDIDGVDILLVDETAFGENRVQSYIEGGGKVLCIAEADMSAAPKSRIIDRFTSSEGVLETDRGLESADGCTWYGWAPSGDVRILQCEQWGLQQDIGRLSFSEIAEPGAYAYACFESPLLQLDEGALCLKYESDVRNLEDLARVGTRLFDRTIGILLRDADDRWFLCSEDSGFTLGKNGTPRYSLADLEWREVTNVQNGKIQGRIETGTGSQPDFSCVRGAGIYHFSVPEKPLDFWFSKVEWTGRAAPGALIPFNGPRHRLLADIDQQDLSFWRGGSTTKTLHAREQCNVRVVLAGNKDGHGSALYEQMSGDGIAVVTSLKLTELDTEPAAHGMIKNSLSYLRDYEATKPARTVVFTEPELRARLDELGLVRQDALTGATTIIIDGANARSAREAGVSDLVRAGASLLVCNTDADSMADIRELTGRDMSLTEPFLGERRHCVKAAVSWTKADTPPVMCEYYEGIMTHQPFEPNYDPLLAGLVNRDLDWDGAEMFREGIEIRGMDPVRACADYSILVSNWRIDWRKPSWGGEYIHAAKDQKRAHWFVNRDPVVLKIRHGAGQIVFCQLDLLNDSEQARRLTTQLLTNMGCAIGRDTRFAAAAKTFDLNIRANQIERFEEHYRFVSPVSRQYYGTPEGMREAAKTVRKPEEKTPTLLIGDELTVRYYPYAVNKMWEAHDVQGITGSAGSTREGVGNVKQQASSRFNIIQFSFGLEDLKLGSDGKPEVGLDEFTANLQEIVSHLKTTGAKLYWTTIIPIPKGDPEYRAGDEVAYNAAAQEIMDANGVYTNDLYRFVMQKMPDFVERDKLDFMPELLGLIGNQVAEALMFFGAQ
ncbi:MAG: hypothetical protein K9N51_00010 [Candidatus Pacebacteria bacterium]|nr:hypothetical protein [Candidatus Paceibacterota bacterium]